MYRRDKCIWCHVAWEDNSTLDICSRCKPISEKQQVFTEEEKQTMNSMDEYLEAFLRRASNGGAIVSTATLTPQQIAIARAAGRMLVLSDGIGFVHVEEAARVSELELTVRVNGRITELTKLQDTLQYKSEHWRNIRDQIYLLEEMLDWIDNGS